MLNLFTIHKQHLNHSMCIYLCHIRGSECTQHNLIKRIGSRGRGRWRWTCYLLLRWCLLVVVLELLLKLLTNLQDKQDHGWAAAHAHTLSEDKEKNLEEERCSVLRPCPSSSSVPMSNNLRSSLASTMRLGWPWRPCPLLHGWKPKNQYSYTGT